MSTREDVIKAKLALQDSIRATTDPKKKKAMQKRFDKMRIPTHAESSKDRDAKLRAAISPNAVEAMRKRQATLDSLRKAK